MGQASEQITVAYDSQNLTGRFSIEDGPGSSGWTLVRLRALESDTDCKISETTVEVPWSTALDIMRELGSRKSQLSHGFRFAPTGEAKEKLRQFADEFRRAQELQGNLTLVISEEEIESRLIELGFTKRKLRWFQLRDLRHLLSLSNGANFSVPGAGKTTVTLALHLLTRKPEQHLLVVCPKTAMVAWASVIEECLGELAEPNVSEAFTFLEGDAEDIDSLLSSGATRFVITYDLLIRRQSVIRGYLSRNAVHVVLDESHRMKAGFESIRGSFLLAVSDLPVRRDILSGTPMPQSANDIGSQLNFLWPGHGLDLKIGRGVPPKKVLGNLYVRTTKKELGLPPVTRHFRDIEMGPGQLALYSIVRNEAIRQFRTAVARRTNTPDFIKARRSVMRLLQLSVNPSSALHGMSDGSIDLDSGVVSQVIEEGTSNKIEAVIDEVRRLAKNGRKSVVWTIFTDTIHVLQTRLADLNPVTIFGGVPSGLRTEFGTREWGLDRFHNDEDCYCLVANPAAAGEGISLHKVCHDAIYVDRSYVSTHYLQSIDRIHRLGLPPDTETNIQIFRSKAPAEVGSIDLSVSRRLAKKIRHMQELLDDEDLHEVAFDEETADDPIDYDVQLQDIMDLVAELEGKKFAPETEEM